MGTSDSNTPHTGLLIPSQSPSLFSSRSLAPGAHPEAQAASRKPVRFPLWAPLSGHIPPLTCLFVYFYLHVSLPFPQ